MVQYIVQSLDDAFESDEEADYILLAECSTNHVSNLSQLTLLDVDCGARRLRKEAGMQWLVQLRHL